MTEAVLTAGTVLWCLLPQPEDRFLWAKTGFDTLQEYFKPGVNFGQALVNRRRIELFISGQSHRGSPAAVRDKHLSLPKAHLIF